jgi:hypothetical protein
LRSASGIKHLPGELVWVRHPLAPVEALGAGVALLMWMAVEIAIVGYSNSPPLQPFYVLLEAVITGVGLGWRVTSDQSRCARHDADTVARIEASVDYLEMTPDASGYQVCWQLAFLHLKW